MVIAEPVKRLYPFESKWFDLPGGRMHYLDEGEGEPVVMVHGNPTWSFYYRELAKALRGTRRVIAPDHLGMGLSDKPALEAYAHTLDARVQDLEALLEHLIPEGPVSLVLHDWGGMIGMTWAALHPERIKKLVLLNTAAFPLPAGVPVPWQLKLARSPLGPLLVKGLNGFVRGAIKDCVVKPMPRDVATGYALPYDSWANRAAVLRFVEDIPLQAGDPGWDTIHATAGALEKFRHTPTRIYWGAQDFVFNDGFLDEWKRRLPHAEVKRFEGAGHYVLEDAADVIIPEVKQFLG